MELFLCPSGLQEMLDVAQKYTTEHKISFSTHPTPSKSKTKGIIFSEKPLKYTPTPVLMCGNSLPWVENAKYLGNKISSFLDGHQKDIKEKRAKYIERNCELLQEFSFAHPAVKCNLNRIYNSSFSGSVLWDLSSVNASQVVNSWSYSVREMWDLPYNAHRYLIEELSGTHAKSMLISRFVKFVQSIRKSSKLAVQFVLQKVMHNKNTLTGKNVHYVLTELNKSEISEISPADLRKHQYCPIKEENKWRTDILKELTNVKKKVLTVGDDNSLLSEDEITDVINFVCTS